MSDTKPQVADLDDLLEQVFGLEEFRPFQREVCEAVAKGQDCLLVMPTGAGKSLCYQLPGLALGGTTLVVSPLIALMEDQVAKLAALGLRAGRIHSGRDRSESRTISREYLDGNLDYLFIAPERLSVPGFPEMLARRKPALIAVDEAHCISQWGHDFRPDYRLLGQRLPLLRPAPVIGLTATATVRVQDDIMRQLGIEPAGRHIHGFRRTNIAVEVAELRPSVRNAAVSKVLADRERRPAIVYAPTRKTADALGKELSGLHASSYHAGMTTKARDRVQTAFLAGRIDVIVATIAFGMGIDKANVRTVIHTGLPGSLEAYYQEIGRAGRDGLPSRAFLLYGYSDRRTHEFFFGRDYPEPVVLEQIFATLSDRPEMMSDVRNRVRVDPEIFGKAVEKLWVHGGALVEPDESVRKGKLGWRDPYLAQRSNKAAQLGDMTRFAESHRCRMLALVEHFGDRADSGEACGTCDVCASEDCVVQKFRPADAVEREVMKVAIELLGEGRAVSVGQLHRDAAGKAMDRDGFERVLGGLARVGCVVLENDSFEKDGHVIAFQRVRLLRGGAGIEDLGEVTVAEPPPGPPSRRRAPSTRKASTGGRKRRAPAVSLDDAEAPKGLVNTLKEWRLSEARRRRIPAFRVLPDRTLLGIAVDQPHDEESLLAVSGIGPTLAKKYGEKLLSIVSEHANG